MKPKDSNSRGVEFTAATAAIRPHVESRVSARIADLLASPEQGWAQAVEEYRKMMPVVAASLAPGFTTRTLERQRQIARAVPDMAPQPAAKPRKPKAKKGGEQ